MSTGGSILVSVEDMSTYNIDNWYRKPGAEAELLAKLQPFGLNEDSITARAMALSCSELVSFDSMVARAEQRRNGSLQEI